MNAFAWRTVVGLVLGLAVFLAPLPANADTKAAGAVLPDAGSEPVPLCRLPVRQRAPLARLPQALAAAAAPAVNESEPNNTQASATPLDFGVGPGKSDSVDVTGTLTVPLPDSVAQAENDGSIPLANPTGLISGGVIVSGGTIGDGPYGTSSGDYDFYSVNALAGERVTIAVTAHSLGSLDSYVGIYSSGGSLLAANDDAPGGGTSDSFLKFVTAVTDTYFVVVRGFGTGFQSNPFDAASGPGAGSRGPYTVTIELDDPTIDFFSFSVNPGDVIGANLTGGAAHLSARDPNGDELVGSTQDVTAIYPDSAPLPGGGRAALSWVASTAGTYAIAVSNGSGPYTLQLRAFRPVLEQQSLGTRQILFLDFAGASVDASKLGGSGVRSLSPLSSFMAGWGLSVADADAVIDAIVATVESNFHVIGVAGQNGDFVTSGIAGEFAIEIRNSRDHADPWGEPNVSRVVVGGTSVELGINTIGISESIDVGNFAGAETSVVLLDTLSDPNTANPSSLNHLPRAASSTIIDLIGIGVGNAVSHEAGHLFGNFHTEKAGLLSSLMQTGGSLATLVGVGQDGIFGSADDVSVEFVAAAYATTEGFTGTEDTVNVNAFGLSTGSGPVVVTPTVTATATVTSTAEPGTPTEAASTPTRTPTRTPSPPIPTATSTASPTPPPPGVCASAPRGGCHAPRRSTLSMRNAGNARNHIGWKWMRGKAELEDFGTPLSTTSYDLCLYDAGGLRSTLSVPPAGTCPVERPCWRTIRGGFAYRDTGLANNGVRSIKLHRGDGNGSISLQGSGTGLPVPTLPLTVPVTVQLVSSAGACWTAQFTRLSGDNLTRIGARVTLP